jgi:uncharacterized protein (DUF58 family)
VLVLAAACLGLGITWGYGGLTTIGVALLVLAVIDAAALGIAGRLVARRTVTPAEVPRYGTCTARLTIEHSGGWMALRAEGVERVGPDRIEVALGRLDHDGGVGYPVPTRRRGRLVIGPLLVRRYGPAGLTVRPGEVAGTATVRVLPRLLPVRAVPPGVRHGHVGAEERVARGGTDLQGLREYLPGDDLRRVHWGTTARAGTLMVREDADPAQAHLSVILDDRAAVYTATDDFEEAVEVAGSLLAAAHADGHPVRLRTVHGGRDLAAGSAGRAERVEDLLAALADVSLVDDVAAVPATVSAPDDLDVVVVVTGGAGDPVALAPPVGRAEVGAVLAVGGEAKGSIAARNERGADQAELTPLRGAKATMATVTVLRASRAEELLAAWSSHAVTR